MMVISEYIQNLKSQKCLLKAILKAMAIAFLNLEVLTVKSSTSTSITIGS